MDFLDAVRHSANAVAGPSTPARRTSTSSSRPNRMLSFSSFSHLGPAAASSSPTNSNSDGDDGDYSPTPPSPPSPLSSSALFDTYHGRILGHDPLDRRLHLVKSEVDRQVEAKALNESLAPEEVQLAASILPPAPSPVPIPSTALASSLSWSVSPSTPSRSRKPSQKSPKRKAVLKQSRSPSSSSAHQQRILPPLDLPFDNTLIPIGTLPLTVVNPSLLYSSKEIFTLVPLECIPSSDSDLLTLVSHNRVRLASRTSVIHNRAARVYLISADTLNKEQQKMVGRSDGKGSVVRALRGLLELVRRNASEWASGEIDESEYESERVLYSKPDGRRMPQIYASLPSPAIEYLPPSSGSRVSYQEKLLSQILTTEEWTKPEGLITDLYPYQIRSVKRMLLQETHTPPARSAAYISLPSFPTSQPLFVNFDTAVISSSAPTVEGCRGGILCEEMGLGKTVMCLTLILLTKDTIAATPEGKHIHTVPPGGKGKTIPSLVDLAIHALQTSPTQNIPTAPHISLEAEQGIRERYKERLEGFGWFYDEIKETFGKRRAGVESGQEGRRRIWRSGATLVLVPKSLLNQWVDEINKHIYEGELRVLIIEEREDPIPPPAILGRSYDIVLMTHDSFSSHSTEVGFDPLSTAVPRACVCPYLGASRTVDCRCPPRIPPSINPLVQVLWKRLIVDEGHVTSSRTSALVDLAGGYLRAERRWVVSGTPTPNLIGLQHFASPSPSVSDKIQQLLPENQAKWSKADFDDVARLCSILSHFLKSPSFPTSASILSPLKSNSYGSIQRLEDVMKSVMVRHRSEDVKADVELPLLDKIVVRLDLDGIAARSYNALQAIILSNKVETHAINNLPNYLFHPNNKESLNQIISNLKLTCFWVNLSFSDLVAARGVAKGTIEEQGLKADIGVERSYTDNDLSKLQVAVDRLSDAVQDPLWINLNKQLDPPLFLAGISTELSESQEWSHMHPIFYSEEKEQGELVSSLAARKLREKLEKPDYNVRKELVSTDMRFLNSHSSKLNFILDQVIKHGKDDKFIIFSQDAHILGVLLAAFDALGVNCLPYGAKIKGETRKGYRTYPTEFQTSDQHRVFLMQLKHASHGLNLTAANRVIFCEPCGRSDVEAQAMKRVHRIGQTKKVVVHVLVARNTLEEEVVRISQRLLGGSQNGGGVLSGTKPHADDGELIDWLKEPRFISLEVLKPSPGFSSPFFNPLGFSAVHQTSDLINQQAQPKLRSSFARRRAIPKQSMPAVEDLSMTTGSSKRAVEDDGVVRTSKKVKYVRFSD